MLSPRPGLRRRRSAATILSAGLPLLMLPVSARAQAPPNYVAALASPTVAYCPPGGPWYGFQHDVTLSLGYGRYVTKTLALELDLGPTWVRGQYVSFSLLPGLVWSVDPHVYLAARFIVPVDPETNFALSPGLGVLHTFANGVSPYLEVNAISYVGRGDPDLGIGVTMGVLFSF